MPRTIGRNLNLCFTKIKQPQQDHSRPLTPNSSTATAILIKNFNTLYDSTAFDYTSNSKSSGDNLSSSESDSETAAAAPDFATVFASQRFFFSSPGPSNSIIESSSSLSSSSLYSPPPENSKSPESKTIVGGGIAIPTFSPDPYMDFRRSMQEMVESRDLSDVRANWDYLHELLLCYLSLNPKSTHKFIVGAFADLLISLLPSPADDGSRQSEFSDGGRKISRRCM